jgi:hypothetical protein
VFSGSAQQLRPCGCLISDGAEKIAVRVAPGGGKPSSRGKQARKVFGDVLLVQWGVHR